MKQFQVILGARRWLVRYVTRLGPRKDPDDGDCDKFGAPVIRIALGQTDREWFWTHLHECMHAAMPYLDEEVITAVSKELTVLFYDKLGYRKKLEEK